MMKLWPQFLIMAISTFTLLSGVHNNAKKYPDILDNVFVGGIMIAMVALYWWVLYEGGFWAPLGLVP